LSEFGRISVTLKGLTPLLMNRLTIEKLGSRTTKTTSKVDVEKEAKESAYIANIDGVEQLYIPKEAIYSMILNTATLFKIDKNKAKSVLAGTIRIEPDKIPLGTRDYEIDLRVVRIQSARIPRARAKVPDWKATFSIVYDKSIKGDVPGTIEMLLSDAGKRIGILDFRPARSGWFGTFTVEKFEVSPE